MSRLYTYLPKDNTALTEGLLSTALSDKGFEKYRGRTGKYKKEDVLKVLDSWEPEWTRSKAISALTEPIPEDAAEDFLEFARNRKLYSFSTKDLIKAKILAHLRRARKGGGTDPVDEVREERPNWHRKKKHLLFQGVPHYFVETTGGRIPPEFVREEKQARVKTEYLDMEKTASLLRKIKNSIKFRGFLRKYDTSKNFRSVLNGKDSLPRYSHDEVVKLLPDHPLFRGAVKDPVHISGASPSVFGPDKSSTTAGSLVVKPENVMREANNMRHVTPNLTWAKWYINDMSKSNGLVSVYDMRKIPELMSGRVGFYEDWEAAKALKNGVFYRKPSSERALKNLSMTNVAEQTRIPKPGRLPASNAGYDRPETLLDVTRNQPDMVLSIPDDRFTYIDMTPLLDVMRPKQTKIEQAMSRLARMKLNKALNTGKVGRGLVNELHRNYNIPVFE
jgi:hypothetical protein